MKAILEMPPLKKGEIKKAPPAKVEEPVKEPTKPPPEPKDEDRIDFVNVKDLIKGMERQKTPKEVKETNGFHKKITDNGHDYNDKRNNDESDAEIIDKLPEKTVEKIIEKADSSESTESTLSRSNSLINGVPVQAPKPLPRSSISEPGAGEEHHEAPKPKPRTTAVPISGYKV